MREVCAHCDRIASRFAELIKIAAITASQIQNAIRLCDVIGNRHDRGLAAANVKLAVTIALRETAEVLRDVTARTPS